MPLVTVTVPGRLARLLNKALAAKITASLEAAVAQVVADHFAVQDAGRSRSRCKKGGSAAKAKGREGCLKVQSLILARFSALVEDDVAVKATSQGGTDLHLSPLALADFGFGIEVKRSESLNIWKALKQAEVNARKKDLPPIVFFSRSHTETYVALEAKEFLQHFVPQIVVVVAERREVSEPLAVQEQV